MSDDGVIVVTVAMDEVTGEVISGPEIISRGFVFVKESEQIILENCSVHRVRDRNGIKIKLRDGISRYLYENTRRSPMILPIILDV